MILVFSVSSAWPVFAQPFKANVAAASEVSAQVDKREIDYNYLRVYPSSKKFVTISQRAASSKKVLSNSYVLR
ncbi:hypothetical protein CPB83DRAFT_898387 [Crepidotus variabilis]|uniref:Uncharacterized protein n=1 Tax=Crepidotus variabilis TaxID=179855 RepID=A0A9P6E7J3_9AGAR|nr:hypothetical protein CPB83DRAFT_898387 [Crepidotus variabilis]